jgi:hypothetical protein
MMKGLYENKFAYYRIDNQIVFLEVKENVVLDFEAAAVISLDRMRLQNDQCYPVLFDIEHLADSSKSGRDYLAHCGWFLASRVVILARSFTPATIAKFYLQQSKPSVTTALFDDKTAALQFLES